jgi:hypothetical protein
MPIGKLENSIKPLRIISSETIFSNKDLTNIVQELYRLLNLIYMQVNSP